MLNLNNEMKEFYMDHVKPLWLAAETRLAAQLEKTATPAPPVAKPEAPTQPAPAPGGS
jgi:hypothetical protein